MRVSIFAFSVAVVVGSALAQASEAPTGAGSHRHGERLAQRHGKASFYDDKFQGRKTATGERFSQEKLTAASKDLPLGSHVTVTNKENGKSVDVKVNDRGPHVKGRVIDLSKKAATKIGITPEDGLAPVKVEARPSSQPTEELKQAVHEKAESTGGVIEAEGSSTPQ
ncbi:MAG: septal ring lytic transglycosylase RlpA family lipoprotein [Rhodospirillales bacterium]|jgi:rare lipoprotein A|nr:septal ring lytic transglycosylase RlpA family lipoprotein [Rhodospirillales bacterium]